MRRRSFLKSAAAFPLSLEALALGQVPQDIPKVEGHVTPAGQDRLGESHSLGFSTILFKVLPRETNGGLFLIEHKNLMKGGPPVHFHRAQEEYFYVMEGEVLFQLGDERRRCVRAIRCWGRGGFRMRFAEQESRQRTC